VIFRPSETTERFIEDVHARVGARNKAVLGRAGLFLALGEGVPSEFEPTDAKGKDLNDETVIGDELRDVVRAALNYRANRTLDETGYRQEFRRHFEFGCLRLRDLWEQAGKDQTRFVAELLRRAGGDLQAHLASVRIPAMPIVDTAVKLKLLADAEEWTINEAGHNGLLVISGKPGSGKSQLALDLLAQVSRQGMRFVFFDLKGELEDDPTNARQKETRKKFFDFTGAQHVRLIRQDLPINPLYRDPNPAVNAQIANEIAALIRAYAPQLGANQQQQLSDAYQSLSQPDFTSLLLELEQNGVTGVPHSLIKRIVDCNLFASAQTGITPEAWLRSSLVVDFKEFGNDADTKSLAVALILNFLMKRLNQNLPVKDNIQPLKMVLFVDEAHLLLPKEAKAGLLGALARQGRSWGFPVWLASQDADAFITNGAMGTDFAELASCGVHFSPETLSHTQQRQILGGVLSRQLNKAEAVLRLHGKMKTGQARQFWKDGGKP
jgi:DNA sulfur modification protein DndE